MYLPYASLFDYEIRRGLLWRAAPVKYQLYLNQIKSQFEWVVLTDTDWRQAAQFWANTRSGGKQLSDVDLLVAALAIRLDAVIVSDDDDFDVLSVKRENWRKGI
jgi:predicted nucleic acid-binding protein